MKRFLVFAIIILGILFLVFALVFFFGEKQQEELSEDENNGQNNEIPQEKDNIAPVSQIVAPQQGDVLGGDFSVEVQEADAGESGLALGECRYSVYDCGSVPCVARVFQAQRSCRSSFVVSVGEGKDCFSQGRETCRVAVFSQDQVGNQNVLSESRGSVQTFGVDLVSPMVFLEASFVERTTLTLSFQGRVEDNMEVSNCELVVDGQGQHGIVPVVFSPAACQEELTQACYSVAGLHTFSGPGVKDIVLRCWDLAGNTKRTAAHRVDVFQNRAPKISFCRVDATEGDVQTTFRFAAEASDPDQDSLSYEWDFGDESKKLGTQAVHQYTAPGTYQPSLTVQDSFGQEAVCSTAWVAVE